MKILFIGDVVGKPGRRMVEHYLPELRKKYQPAVTIVNGENAAGGKGITEKIYKRFLELGAHAVTMGNHVWDNHDIFEFIDKAKYLIRPANFPAGTPGQGVVFIKVKDFEVAVVNLQGRTFLPALDCPFRKADELIASIKKRTPHIFVDFHAEATSEKQALAWYLNGKVSAVMGTHTHVQTADHRILPAGTAFMTDVGMTGPYDGILGTNQEAVLRRFLTQMPVRFEVAQGREQLNGVVINIDKQTGKAKSVEPVLLNEDHPFFE